MKKQYFIILGFTLLMGVFLANDAFGQWTTVSTHIHNTNTGNVGIGYTSPAQKLDVNGNLGLGIQGAIFTRRQNNASHEIFSMDNNNDILINRSSIVSGLPSHVILGVGLGKRFNIRNSNNQNIFSIYESSGLVEIGGNILLGTSGRLIVRRQDATQHEIFSMDNNNDVIINRASIVNNLPSNVLFGVGQNRFFDVRGSSNQIIMRIEEASGNLFVDGKITSTEVEVKLNIWPDFVFSDDYILQPLHEVEAYIVENKSLPGVPSEIEVLNNGVNLGEMSAILLQKIEELTLHIIELNKQNSQLKDRITALEK